MNITTQYRYAAKQIAIFIALISLFAIPVYGQAKRNRAYESYVETYSKVAVDHMKQYKIPASITLAQGILESGAGMSKLATQGNNHFGIKCHNDWKGATMKHNDDLANECFRKYKHAHESYQDHSLFLTERSRYSTLFNLKTTDYIGWARGLQNSGYATDKAYANKLIKIIEDYELYQYDKGYKQGAGKTPTGKPSGQSHTPYITHGLVYVIAKDGDSLENIANEFNFKIKDLAKYNEMPKDFPLQKNNIIYFQKKKKKADKPYYEHTVRIGESMHSIAQRYGMQVKNLSKMNKKDFEYVPTEGDVLKLR